MTHSRRSGFIAPTEWLPEQLEADRLISQEQFRHERLQEPLEDYLDAFLQ